MPTLEAAGHELVALDRHLGRVGRSGRPVLDVEAVAESMRGCDALVSLSPRAPRGSTSLRPGVWRSHDLLCSEGVRCLVSAARVAGVRRVVQQSVSVLYADQGQEWITERSPLCVTTATEPASMGELAVQDYASTCRSGVILRMGLVLGDSGLSRWLLRGVAHGRPIGFGAPDGFTHVIHSDDVGSAVLAGLAALSGTYNVGASPARRADVVDGHAAAVGRRRGEFVGPLRARLAGDRMEPLARSLRVSSDQFSRATGWAPRRDTFDVSWLEAAGVPQPALR
jgi:nucleoside-diphosphate-sugar epimerase